MSLYLLSVYQPDGPVPSEDVLGPIREKLTKLHEEMSAAGVWVFSGGLHPADTSTVVKPDAHNPKGLTLHDGPYVESKEHLGGFTIVDVSDLDAALGWAEKSVDIIGLPIEVRPFIG